jgi:hypothetical protein
VLQVLSFVQQIEAISMAAKDSIKQLEFYWSLNLNQIFHFIVNNNKIETGSGPLNIM